MQISEAISMLIRTPLTTDQIREIQGRNQDSADIKALLWEIKRMRATILFANQVQARLPAAQGSNIDDILLAQLRAALDKEPAVLDERAASVELFKRL